MSYLTVVLLGLVQGITEFLPISSSGHLALLQNIFQVEEADMLLDVLLHLGTLCSIFMVYRKDIRGILRGGLGLVGIGPDKGPTQKRNVDRRRMAVFIIVGSLPLLLALPVRGYVEAMYRNTPLVSFMLMVTGLLLYLAERYSKSYCGLREANVLQALLVGVAQVFAVIPGISRSGATISVGMLCGLKRSFAVRFSFLLSVPAVLGAVVVSLVGASQASFTLSMLPKYFCGMFAAAVSGYFSIRLLRYLAARSNFGGFAYYCWSAGLIALLLSLIA